MADENVREQLKNILMADVVNSRRLTDGLREALISAIIKKADDLTASELISVIREVDKTPVSQYREILDLLGN